MTAITTNPASVHRRGGRSATSSELVKQASKLPGKVPGGAVGAVSMGALGFAAGVAGGVRLGSRGKLLGIRLRQRSPLGERIADAVRGAVGAGVEGGRVLRRLSAIECELHELRIAARPAQRRSPIEVTLGALTRRPGEPR